MQSSVTKSEGCLGLIRVGKIDSDKAPKVPLYKASETATYNTISKANDSYTYNTIFQSIMIVMSRKCSALALWHRAYAKLHRFY